MKPSLQMTSPQASMFFRVCLWLLLLLGTTYAQSQTMFYRNLQVKYDSIIVMCTYGEMFLLPKPNSTDSVEILWVNDLGGGIDSSEAFLSKISQTRPFALHDGTRLSFFRLIGTMSVFCSLEPSLQYSIPDSSAWTLELWRLHPKERVMTLDSCGIAQAINIDTKLFPDRFGCGAMYMEPLTVAFPDEFTSTVSDSVFITLRIWSWASPGSYKTSIVDWPDVDFKLSDDFRAAEKDQVPKSLEELSKSRHADISIPFDPVNVPNVSLCATIPTKDNFRIVLTDSAGGSARQLFEGVLDKGYYLVPVVLTGLTRGEYELHLLDSNNEIVAQRFISIAL